MTTGTEDALRAALRVLKEEFDVLVNIHYGGELPCNDEQLARLKLVRDALSLPSSGEQRDAEIQRLRHALQECAEAKMPGAARAIAHAALKSTPAEKEKA